MTVTKNTDSESFGFQQSTPEVHGSNPVFRDINLNIYFLLIGLKIKTRGRNGPFLTQHKLIYFTQNVRTLFVPKFEKM